MEDILSQPQMSDESLEEIGRQREFQISQKKKFFNKIKFVFFILLLTGSGLFITYVIVQRQRTTAPTKPVIVDETTPTPNELPENIWELSRNDDLKVFVKVPPEAKYFTYENPAKLEVVFSKAIEDFSQVTEKNLLDGYIFRVTPLSIGTRDLTKIVEIKRESYKIQCPPTATVTVAQNTLVDTVDAKYFEVKNCNVDYKYTYIPRFGIYYEIAQIYRGDVGIGQQYAAQTEELLKDFRFFPEDSPKPYDPYASYFNDAYNFSIKYPAAMETTCCDLKGPADAGLSPDQGTVEKLLVAAYMQTYKSSNEFDGFALYLLKSGRRGSTSVFNQYFESQKQKLVEDYKVVTGSLPNGTEEDIVVGEITGKKLTGYHWQGTQLIYLPIETPGSKAILIIAIRDRLGGDFSTVIDEVLKSFEIYTNL